jgi:hypothetical protein
MRALALFCPPAATAGAQKCAYIQYDKGFWPVAHCAEFIFDCIAMIMLKLNEYIVHGVFCHNSAWSDFGVFSAGKKSVLREPRRFIWRDEAAWMLAAK